MTQIELFMKKLGCTKEEALDIIKTDKEINKGADPFPLTAEQKKVEKAARACGTRKTPTVYKFQDGKQKKANPQKEAIIAEIAKFLAENGENAYENVEITNKNRMIAFSIGEKSFELTLVEKERRVEGLAKSPALCLKMGGIEK